MEIIYREAAPSDAAKLLSYLKDIGSESDNLSFGAEVISLEVRSDNERAKALYRKFGFSCIGVFEKFVKIGDACFSADLMNLYL